MITLSKSAGYKEEYSCSIIRIGELLPIEGSDFLVKTIVNGNSIVVRKDEIKEGDIMFYVMNECQLNEKFLSKNNLYEEYTLNSNAAEYEKILAEKGKEEARRLCGYIPKNGRIRIIKLRGCPSMGFIFSVNSMANWKDGFKDFNMEEHVGEFFDTVNDDLFVKAYVPYCPQNNKGNRSDKRNKRLKKFDRMVTGEFSFHYDTNPLGTNMHNFTPDDKVCISVKLHGTSAIFANVHVKKPIYLSVGQKAIRKAIRRIINDEYTKLEKAKYTHAIKIRKRIDYFSKILKPNYTIGYGNVYASRTVIKNQYINRSVGSGFYNVDVWGYVNDLIKKYIPRDMIVYGEIVGYTPGGTRMIQKGYDYMCAPGTCKLMIYRIVMNRPGQNRLELDVKDVLAWTKKLLERAPELKELIHPIDILYNGTFAELYPDLDPSEHWHENVLARLKEEQRFGMEQNEPLNKITMPREGICIRIDGDETPRAFKLKCIKFLEKEAKAIDAGEVDIEMEQVDY